MTDQPKISVPFLDLTAQYSSIQPEIDRCLKAVCQSGSFILGEQVRKFEEEFAAYLGSGTVVGVANGTDALMLSYRALGIGRGDEVIIPAHTFAATAIAVAEAGATPVLVDIEPANYLIDIEQIDAAITSKTKAICPVHLYGRAADMDRISAIAKRRGLALIEDTAQAHGAYWNGRRCGTFGQAGCFSFYPGKNLGAYGDGGAVFTADPAVAQKLRRLRSYGSERKYEYPEPGINSRLDEMQAAILRVKLARLDEWNARRRQAAGWYIERLAKFAGGAIKLPELPDGNGHVFHLFVIETEKRDQLALHLQSRGIGVVIHYPRPFFLEPAFSGLKLNRDQYPAAVSAAARVLSLPLFPEITEQQIDTVAAAVAGFF